MEKNPVANAHAALKTLSVSFGAALFSFLLLGSPARAQITKSSTVPSPTFGPSFKREWAQPELRKIIGGPSAEPMDADLIQKKFDTYREYQKTRVNPQLKTGGVGSGGGTGYGRGLLDLALYNPEAFNDSTPGDKVVRTRAFLMAGFDRIDNDSFPTVQKAIRQIEKWSSSSPQMTGRISRSLRSLSIFYVDGFLDFSGYRYELPTPSRIQPEDLFLMGVYSTEFGNLTSAKRFESLSEKNQIGYFVHEALRQMQIDGELLVSDDALQKLTARLLREPREGETVDTGEIMRGPILDSVVRHWSLLLKIQAVSRSSCLQFGVFCSIGNLEIPSLMDAFAEFAKKLNPLSERDPRAALLEKQVIGLLTDHATYVLRNLTDDVNAATKRLTRISFGLARALSLVNQNQDGDLSQIRALKQIQSQMAKMGFMSSRPELAPSSTANQYSEKPRPRP